MLIYKVLRPSEWADLQANGHTAGAPIDLADGFVHFSNGEQLATTLALHFTETPDLILLACDADALGDALKWDPSRGGALFPHLYRDLRLADVLWHADLPLKDGIHALPDTVT